MIRRLAASAAFLTLSLAGCDRAAQPAESVAETAAAPAPEPSVAPPAPAPATTPVAAGDGTAAAPGAPSFALLYPGATADTPAVIASGEAGEGGMVTFRTDASPDEVIAYYREQAAQAGLRPVMGMNQGDARAYGAADGEPDGAKLQVVAAPSDGTTSVQLSWSEGR